MGDKRDQVRCAKLWLGSKSFPMSAGVTFRLNLVFRDKDGAQLTTITHYSISGGTSEISIPIVYAIPCHFRKASRTPEVICCYTLFNYQLRHIAVSLVHHL